MSCLSPNQIKALKRIQGTDLNQDNYRMVFGRPAPTTTSNGLPYATGPLSFLSACYTGLLWPNGWMDQDSTWYGCRPRQQCVRWRPRSPWKVAEQPLCFSAHVYHGQMAGWISIPHGTEVGLGSGNVVLDGDPAPPTTERGTAATHFSDHVYCGQRVVHLSNWWALVLINSWTPERRYVASFTLALQCQ